MMGRSFDESGAFDRRRFHPELADLSLPLERTPDGDLAAKPCAEAILGSRAAGRLLAAGVMPLQSIVDRAAVRLGQLVSVADPPAPLAVR
jgi:type VI secretion system protein ImpC